MTTIILTALTLGFIGSSHCVGMCGPIALALPLDRSSMVSKVVGAILYNSGRLFVYAILGGLFGLLGQSFVIAGYQQILSITIGACMLIFILMPNTILNRNKLTRLLYTYIGKVKQKLGVLFKKSSFSSLFLIGTLNGLLPCGLVYLGIAGAIATGNSIEGSVFMLIFGLGTLPAMFFLSLLGNSINMNYRNKINKAIPAFLVATAVLLILRGMNLGIPYVSPEMSETKPVAHKCCHK